jgi:hypothetical protein
MHLDRRSFLLMTAAPMLAGPVRRSLIDARFFHSNLGEVFFCRVSDASLLPVARSIFPRSVASLEPRPGFQGITFCGTDATLTVTPDRLG